MKEASSTRSEWDVKPRREDGTPVSIFREIEAGTESSDEAVARKEEDERRKRVINDFETFLEKEPELLVLFREIREGATDLKELGQKLGMDERAVTRCRKRLARRAAVFEKRNGGS